MNVKRSLSILLAALLCISLLPGPALAADVLVPEEGTVPRPELPQYTVCLMGHGGVTDGNANQVSEAFDKAGYVLPECPFEREGYTFAGWSADYGRTATGQPGDSFPLTNRFTFLYAMWEKAFTPTIMAGKVLAEGDTPHRVHWTLYEDGTLTLKPNDRYGCLDKDEAPWNTEKVEINGESVKAGTLIRALVIENGDGLGFVPEYMNFIPERLFIGLGSLETVTVNGSLRGIDAQAFQNCVNLTEVTIHGNMGGYDGGLDFWGGIGDSAFMGCKKLARFNVDGVISNIGDSAFSGCDLSSLDATVGGDIGACAFSDNTGLWYISPIRGSVGNYAFKGTNMNRKNVVYLVSNHSGTLGKGEQIATSLGDRKFLFPSIRYTGTEAEFNTRYTNNSGLSIFDFQGIGDDVTWTLNGGILQINGYGPTIDLLDYTEQPWLNIPGRTWDENREQITKVKVKYGIELGAHMLDYLEDRVEYYYDYSGTIGDISWNISNGILTISGKGAIPSLYQRDDAAWMPYRDKIREIIIEEGVTGVGFGSFMQCPNLTSVSFPESVTGIAGGAFYQCPKLDNVSLPGKLKTLGSNAFTDCAGLKTVYIPGSVTSIGSQAFDHTGLTDIYYGGATADWAALGKGEVTGATVRIDGVSGVRFHASAYGLPPMAGEEHSHIAACTAPTVCLECGETVEDAVIVHDHRLQSDADGCYYQCADCGDILVRLRHYTECLDPDAESCAFCGFPLKDAAEYEKGLHVGAYDQVYGENGKLYHECVCMECGETVLEKHEVEPVAKDEGEADFHSLVCAADGFVVDLEEHNWIAGEDGRAVCAVCGAAKEAFPVTFDANAHGRPSRVVTVPAGEPVERPADPTAAGYVFGGWYLEPECLTPYDFSAPVTAELVLYAKWTAQPSRSSGGGGGGSVTYGITVDKTENGGVTASPAYAAQGRTVTLTVKPDEGYQLDKLTVTDKNGQEVAVTSKEDGSRTFTMPGSAVTVAASFAAETPAPEPEPEPEPGGEGCPKDETCPVSAFTDASPDAWYHDGVHWALENGVMNGTGETTFDPNGSTTRAMVVTMLWRLEGKPTPDAPAPFTDVEPGAWYADAVAWAAESGVVKGITQTEFAPNAPVTREQLAAILYRCAQAKGQGFTGMWYFPLDFKDAAAVSEYADEAIHWMVMKGIIKGRTETTLNPKNQSSRAEIATILMRYFTAIGAE